MRLHHLRMRAFGPFADETVVDFDALGADGLFLLHGQTGAGKTTVLDAVAFALYGRVPGARDINRRLHSDHAPAEVAPEVELEATIAGRRLRITRSPDHERPKKRGTGVTKVNAKATLDWVDGSGVNLTRIPEIADEVNRLLGMSAEQFFQVVLLPQGDFARFLRATSQDREELLEKLFDTERFGDLEEWLRERARESATTLSDRMADLDRVAHQIVALGGTTVAEPDFAWAQDCLDAARTSAAELGEIATAAQAHADQAQAAHDHGKALTELRRRGEDARARLASLAQGAAGLSVAHTALGAARQAAPLVSLFEDADRTAAALSSATAECDAAQQELTALPDGAALCPVAEDAELESAIAGWSAESGRLEPLAERLSRRPLLVADIEALTERIDSDARRLGELDEALGRAPERRIDAERELTRAIEARSGLARLEADRDRLADIAKAIAERDAVLTKLTHAERALLDARDKHSAAREHSLNIRERRLAGMAAELASELVDGEPCVVCGAADHPAPASRDTAGHVGEAEEAQAVAAVQTADEVKARAESAFVALGERRAHLDEIVGAATAEQVTRERREVVDSLAAAERLAGRVPELTRSLDAIDTEIDAWRTERSGIEAEQAARRERLTGVRAALTELDAEVTAATGDRIDVTERRTELGELCRRAEVFRRARQEAAQARARSTAAAERLAAKCTGAGFADIEQARTAMATDRQVAEWERLIADAAAVRAAAESTLADEAVSAALEAEAVDVAAVAAAARTAREARDITAKEHAVAARRVTDLERYVADFWNAADALAPAQARHDEVQGLADLVSGRGRNARKMSLRSYVLAARLEEVLVAASVRLRQMSSGRYEFVHSDAAGPRGRRGGLGIDVRDEYTGVTRATTTLSGGETFFASLALALGLADVVAAESGGHVLDTVVIDEGFGTLDPEALDLVMGVLDELRSGGRVVGVVSHVDELRARIPSQLHVIRNDDGSRVRLSGVVGVS